MADYGIIPPSGAYGTDWAANHVLTQGKHGSISMAGWTEENQGFIQQTFLGASIASFSCTAGFGDTSSNLTVSIAVDEYHSSDGTALGNGDDPYHNGIKDYFRPPVVGTPVFFKFGTNHADVEQAYRKTIDDLTGYKTIPDNIDYPTYTVTGDITNVPDGHYRRSVTTNGKGQKVHTFVDKSVLSDPSYGYRGKDHFVFGGILQSWTQNKSATGGQGFNVRVSDPREILSNVTVLLNNYQGSTHNNHNLINVYGFLEYDPSSELLDTLEEKALDKSVLKKNIDVSGVITYTGDDTYTYTRDISFDIGNMPPVFPITGQGFSRRGVQGMPWYRISQALNALFDYEGTTPQEYKDAGFGGTINFRGYKYVVDFSGLPLDLIPKMYFIDFNQIDLLSLAQEICDITSHDLFVSLVPVINHPAQEWLYNKNQSHVSNGDYNDIIAGVIRIDAINRTEQPKYGAIQSYIQTLENNGIETDNQDIGFELSNITTDKFVVGAQEVNMYYFHGYKDRNTVELRKLQRGLPNDFEKLEEDQWSLETSLKQQILPFYGFLGKDAVSIPRGFGSYQQIMLDTTNLFAYGVGNYYIATEIELRAALMGYEDWAHFLKMYNETYMEDLKEYDKAYYKEIINSIDDIDWSDTETLTNSTEDKFSDIIEEAIAELQNAEYAVSVPRCVFNSDRNYMGDDNYPASPCNPPYGYPLYYKRAEKLGIPYAGPASWYNHSLQIITEFEEVKKRTKKKLANQGIVIVNDDDLEKLATKQYGKREEVFVQWDYDTPEAQEQRKLNKEIKEQNEKFSEEVYGEYVKFKQVKDANDNLTKRMQSIGLDGIENSKKVWQFLRDIAEEHLGKKFLVKIPKACNLGYSTDIETGPAGEFIKGPFGFKPHPIDVDPNFSATSTFSLQISDLTEQSRVDGKELFSHYLNSDAGGKYTYGALKNNFNPVSDKWEFNYEPVQDGGFFSFELYDRPIKFTEGKDLNESKLSPATRHMLAPRDISNIVYNNSRVKCYVRFDHSQFLDFRKISKDSMVQQKLVGDAYVPDILEELDNTGTPTETLNRIWELETGQTEEGDNGVSEEKAVAYVSCSVEPQLYMTPKITTSEVPVFGTYVKAKFTPPMITYEENPEDKCNPIPKVSNLTAVIRPSNNGGHIPPVPVSNGSDPVPPTPPLIYADNSDFQRYYDEAKKAWLINTETQELDSEHVYAIITLPGNVIPTVESRYRDAQSLEVNAHQFHHNMTQDVVRGPKGFDKPPAIKTKAESTDDSSGSQEKCDQSIQLTRLVSRATVAARQVRSGKAKAGNIIINKAQFSPSPVYPDLVAIPLMSNERCYGPWMSATSNNPYGNPQYSNVGGRVEFIKDENLAPWNFAGYQLMDEAGRLSASFSNSLLLFSERGSFTIPAAPTGVSLATALKQGGPLVTNIDVNIGNDGVKTSVKMDLYTSSFGKLQKQKENAIANIARERQRIIDQNNSNTRKNFGKNATKNDFMQPLREYGKSAERTLGTNQNNSPKPPDLLYGDPQTGTLSFIPEQTEGSDAENTAEVFNLDSQRTRTRISDIFTPFYFKDQKQDRG